MITRNFDKLRREVAAHVAADTIVQGTYWDEETHRGCFIGCLARSNDSAANEAEYGLPIMLQRIAENIFETLPASDAKAFFAALPDAVGCDGKDLSKVSWQFLAAELRSLPPQTSDIQAVIDPVITGLDLLAAGHDWPHAHAAQSAQAAYAANATAAYATTDAARAARAAANAAANAARATAAATYAAHAAHSTDAAYATTDAARAARAAANAAANAARATAAARLRQRSLLLQLISDAPTP